MGVIQIQGTLSSAKFKKAGGCLFCQTCGTHKHTAQVSSEVAQCALSLNFRPALGGSVPEQTPDGFPGISIPRPNTAPGAAYAEAVFFLSYDSEFLVFLCAYPAAHIKE